MDMATDADINIEHRLTEVEQRAKEKSGNRKEKKYWLVFSP